MSKLDEIIKACQETPLEKTASETKTEQNLSDGIVSLLSKQANTNTLNRDDLDQMRKEAQDAGVALAHEILKQANLVNPTMESLAAEQDAADLDNAQGTVNQIKEELIRRSLRDNAMYPNAEVEDMLEGKTEADAEAASQVKAAAISELVAQGFDFDTAADLVKQAVAPVYTPGQHQTATLNRLNASAPSYPSAGSAAAYTPPTRTPAGAPKPVYVPGQNQEQVLSNLKKSAPKYPSLDKDIPVDPLVAKVTGKKSYKYGPSKGKTGPVWGPLTLKDKALATASDSVKFVRRNKLPIGLGLGATALAGGAAYAYGKHQEKTAYVNELVAQGYDFDMAVDMVKQASYEADKELQARDSGFDKAAAVSNLVKEGYSFEDAADLVKLASEQHEAELYKAAAIEEFVNQGLDYDLSVALVKEAAEGRDDLYQELLASMSE